jgi:maleylpyruvate isomerase
MKWLFDCTALFLRTVHGLTDDELDQDSALPGWTRRHVIAHVATNAMALGRLVSWARTGVESRMYASTEQRAEEIERESRRSPAKLRAAAVRTAAELGTAFAEMSTLDRTAEVVTAQGRIVHAAELPWLRTREVAVHTTDLAAGIGFDDLSDGFCEALVHDVVAWRSARGTGPALTLNDHWHVHGPGPPVEVHLPVARLAAWLTGRESPPGLPDLTQWI